MQEELTPRQAQVLDFVRQQLWSGRSAPSREEIAAAFGFASPFAAERHLQALARKGYIELVPGTNRNIRLCEPVPEPPRLLPLVGRVAAGAPLLAVEHIEARYPCPAVFSRRADYFLRVRGDSMSGAGIHSGDLLVVHSARTADSGRIVVARIDDEVTVKTLQKRRGTVRLLPANPAFEAIVVDGARQTLTIEGVVIGVVRIL